jgi:hypothetical protein
LRAGGGRCNISQLGVEVEGAKVSDPVEAPRSGAGKTVLMFVGAFAVAAAVSWLVLAPPSKPKPVQAVAAKAPATIPPTEAEAAAQAPRDPFMFNTAYAVDKGNTLFCLVFKDGDQVVYRVATYSATNYLLMSASPRNWIRVGCAQAVKDKGALMNVQQASVAMLGIIPAGEKYAAKRKQFSEVASALSALQ